MKIKKLRESKFSFKQYQRIDESYDTAERFVKLLAKPLKLGKYEKEMFEHDINNLRADEWIDLVKSLPENTPGRNEFIELYDKDTLDEDVSYEWKPNTSFKHIKDIYNKVKNNDYKYVNNEREEFMAAVKKAENKGYKPEECRQIKDWHREIWQKNRKINERYNKSDVNSVADFLDTIYKFNTMDDKYKCVCDILDKHDSESSVSIEKDELIKFAKNYKGKILEESLGSDYSHIEEVKSIDFSNDKNNNLPGIPNTKKFKNALNSVGQDAFKIRTSRLKGISTADLKDEFGGNGMKPWKFFKDWDNSVKGFNEFYFFYKTDKLPKKSTNEAFDVDKVQKRIAHVDEFDNGHVIHNDWTRMSSQEAEDKAKQMSVENPDKVYYVKYDDVMEPCSDIKWKNGEQLTEDVPMEYTDTSNFKNLQDESDEYQAELKRKNTNRDLLHKIFDKYGLRTSDEKWADKVYWMFANAQEITVVDDASKVPHKTNDGQKIKYIISTPNAEVDVHADAFEDYIWVVTKDSLETQPITEDLSGKYSDKFKALVNTYEDDSEVLLVTLKEMIRYCKEDDLKDLWIEKEYDRLVNPNDVLEEATGKYTIMAFDNGDEFKIGVTNNIKSAFKKAKQAKDDVYQDAWVINTKTGEKVNELEEDMYSIRTATNKVIELVDDGILDWESVARAALSYMSEYDVADMAETYEWFESEDDDDELYESLKEKLNLDKDGKALKRIISRLVLDSDDELKDFVMEVTKEVIDERKGKLDEDFEGEPLKGPKEGPEAGISSLLNNAIQDEFSTIQLYNDIAVTARAEGFEDIANAIDAINTDENTHVGQLQDLLKTISPNAEAIDSNQEWAEKYNEIGKLDDFVSENLMNESISVKQLLAIAKKSSKIKLKDMKRAINNFSK